VVPQEGRPTLISARRARWPFRHVLGYRPRRDAQSKFHQQLIRDPFLTAE
jgi:hypothetical protein